MEPGVRAGAGEMGRREHSWGGAGSRRAQQSGPPAPLLSPVNACVREETCVFVLLHPQMNSPDVQGECVWAGGADGWMETPKMPKGL